LDSPILNIIFIDSDVLYEKNAWLDLNHESVKEYLSVTLNHADIGVSRWRAYYANVMIFAKRKI